MRKEIISEINRIRFLVGYSEGKVISEQNTIILEQKIEDGKPNFRALVTDLRNDLYPEWDYIPDKSNFTDLTGDSNSFVAVISNNQFKRLTRGTLYLRANGDVFKDKRGTESVIGKWYYKSTPTGKHKFELKVDINKQTKTDDNSSNISDVKTDPVTKTETTNEFIKTSSESIEYFHGNHHSLFIYYSEGKEVYSPIDGVIDNADNLFTSVKGATESVTIHGFEPSVKKNDEVKKGQLLGKIKKPISNIYVYDKNGKTIDPKPLFNIK